MIEDLFPPRSGFVQQYDEAGNITRIDRPNWSVNYSYDLNSQLIGATYEGATILPNEHYEYDPVGNRLSSHLSSTYTYDELNRLLEDDTCAYEWDDNGSLTAKIDKSSGAATFFHHGPDNKLRSIELPDGRMISFTYDATGRRVARTVNGVTEKFHYDGDDVLFDTNVTDNITVRYVNLPNTVDQKVYATEDGQQYTYLRDHLGTIWKVLDSQGNVVKDYVYDSFGQMKGQTGTLPNRYTYTGREIEPESGLYYYRARFYDPEVGRFMLEDQLKYDENINVYIYVNNNPLIDNDPTGNNCKECAKIPIKHKEDFEKCKRNDQCSAEHTKCNDDCGGESCGPGCTFAYATCLKSCEAAAAECHNRTGTN